MKLKRVISAITSLIMVLSASGTGLMVNAQADTDITDEQSSGTTDPYTFDDYEMTLGEVLSFPAHYGSKPYKYVIEDNEIAGYGIDGEAEASPMNYLSTIVAKNVGETTYSVTDLSDKTVVATRKIKVDPVRSSDIKLSDPEIKVDSVNGAAEGIVSIKTTDDILYHYINDELIMVDSNVKDSYLFSTISGDCKEYIWHKDGILTLDGVNMFDEDVTVTDLYYDKSSWNLYAVTNDGTLWIRCFFDEEDEESELKAINNNCDRYAGHEMFYRKDGVLCNVRNGYEIGKINMVDFCEGVNQLGDCVQYRGNTILDDQGNMWVVEIDSDMQDGRSPYKLILVSDEVSKIDTMVMSDNSKMCIYVKTDGKMYSLITGEEIKKDGIIFTEKSGYHDSGIIYNEWISYSDVKATFFDDKTANVKYKNEGIKITDVEDVVGCQTAALIVRTDGTLWRYAGGDTLSQVDLTPSPNTGKQTNSSEQSGDDNSIIYGDTNGDGEVDILDIIDIAKHLLGDKVFNARQIKAVDFNENGSVEITEMATVKQYIMKDKITLGPKNK